MGGKQLGSLFLPAFLVYDFAYSSMAILEISQNERRSFPEVGNEILSIVAAIDVSSISHFAKLHDDN